MHYITGTHFTIKQTNSPLGARGDTCRGLPVGNTYQLIYISKADDGLDYYFVDIKREKHKVKFQSARDADAFIAKHKGEAIPNYEERTINNDSF